MLFQKLLGAGSATSSQYVGGRTFGFSGTTSNVTISLLGTLSGGLASSPSNGDIIIVYFGTGSTADRNLVVSGYTEVAELYANSTFDTNLVVAYRVYSFGAGTITLTGGSLSANDAGAVAIQVWRGVDAVTPLDVTSTTATTTNSVLCDPPAITPITNGAIIISGGAGAHNEGGGQTFSSSDLTGFISVGQGDTNDVTVGLGYKVWTSGAFDPAQFTFSEADSTTYSSASVTLALRPA
jgi:hypothetical protein